METIYHNILMIKYDNNTFEQYYNQSIAALGVKVFPFSMFSNNKEENGLLGRAKRFARLANFEGYNIKRYKLIIVFEYKMLIPIIWAKKSRNARLILWLWNTVSSNEARKINALKPLCEIWTFDPKDAQKYGWNLNEQFYFVPTSSQGARTPSTGTNICAFLIAFDKGRYNTAKVIRQQLLNYGVNCDFHMVKESTRNYDKNDEEWLTNQTMPYDELLERIRQSDIIVELVRPGQTGLTVRALEAVFYSKKLITNNAHIVNTPLYKHNHNNIFVFGIDDEQDLSKFVKKDFQPWSSDVKKYYSVEQWICRFSE